MSYLLYPQACLIGAIPSLSPTMWQRGQAVSSYVPFFFFFPFSSFPLFLFSTGKIPSSSCWWQLVLTMANETGTTIVDISGTSLAIRQTDSFGESRDNDYSLIWEDRKWNKEAWNNMKISYKWVKREGNPIFFPLVREAEHHKEINR